LKLSPELLSLLDEIREEVRETRHYTGREVLSERVLAALSRVPRHEFVSESQRAFAYANHPLPIGHGQTISQPYIVALMSELLETTPEDQVLEIGAGCGYQSAVLSSLVKQVYSLEIIPELATAARERLARLGYANVEVRQGDGRTGWPEHAPYDGILVAAAALEVPRALFDQLRPGGRLLIPVGGRLHGQQLLLIEKDIHGRANRRAVLPVIFVPLTGPESDRGSPDSGVMPDCSTLEH
jgi:protein-L-isoaspartate(D-aspartate) O-methyltransferase